MEILENKAEWSRAFNEGWRAHLAETGRVDWKQYSYARNRTEISSPGIDPGEAKLMVVSTAGAYLPAGQEAFAAADPYGDYSTRLIPVDTPLAELDYAHDHYDHEARRQDPRVNLPQEYLAEMVEAGELGGLTGSIVSCSGYQPDLGAVVDRVVPEVLITAEREEARAALLVPV